MRPLAPLPRFVLAATLACMVGACGLQHPTRPSSGPAPFGAAVTTGASGRFEESADDEVVATLVEGVNAQQVADDHGATLADWESEERCATFVPPAGMTRDSLLAVLEADARCEFVDLNEILESSEARQQSFAFDDGLSTPQTYVSQDAARVVRLDAAHFVARGRGVPIAILDTGIDPTHPALAGRILAGRDFVDGDSDPAESADGVDQDADGRADEAFGHGTHVAGIVALTAPESPLLIVRVLDADGRGDVLQVAAGIRWAVQHGARVINLSMGMLRSVNAVQDALDEAEELGVVVVCSAGNWGALQPEEFPARSSHAFAVAATDVTGRPAGFTSFGQHVALSAPGVAVRSAYPGGGYRLWSGTSMAAPFVAGAAALIVERNPGLDPDEVIGRLRWSARPIRNPKPEQVGNMGRGMLDVLASVVRDHVPVSGEPEPAPQEGIE